LEKHLNPIRVAFEASKASNLHSGLGQYVRSLGMALETGGGCALNWLGWSKNADHNNNTIKPIDRVLGVSGAFDVWHHTHQQSRLFPRRNLPQLVTIHDLNFLEKDYGAWRMGKKMRAVQNLVNRCSGVVFISEFTRDLCMQHLRLPQRQWVIYNGNPMDAGGVQQAPKACTGNWPFLFSIGMVQEKKQFDLIPGILALDKDMHWVLAGMPDPKTVERIRSEAHRWGVSSRVHLLGGITEAEKRWCYAHCKALVFPSKAEGFGLPVVEAYSMGKPVLLSRCGSLPEMGKDWAHYAENQTPEAYREAFLKAESEGWNLHRKSEWQAYARGFTWEQAAQNYLHAYQSIP
jgi:glycosyltransferase involved in cell wall biosynthesis